jgi:hypothetical protein
LCRVIKRNCQARRRSHSFCRELRKSCATTKARMRRPLGTR